jgi:hypothetical protein
MSVGKTLYTTSNIFHAACLHYLYGVDSLAKLIRIDNFKSEFSFAVPVCDAEIDIAAYEKDELTLSSAKAFVHSFNLLSQQQRRMRARNEDQWVSQAWVRGEVG